jgi:hypothetical protein
MEHQYRICVFQFRVAERYDYERLLDMRRKGDLRDVGLVLYGSLLMFRVSAEYKPDHCSRATRLVFSAAKLQDSACNHFPFWSEIGWNTFSVSPKLEKLAERSHCAFSAGNASTMLQWPKLQQYSKITLCDCIFISKLWYFAYSMTEAFHSDDLALNVTNPSALSLPNRRSGRLARACNTKQK